MYRGLLLLSITTMIRAKNKRLKVEVKTEEACKRKVHLEAEKAKRKAARASRVASARKPAYSALPMPVRPHPRLPRVPRVDDK